MMGVKILGTGHYLPPDVLTNDDLSKMVDTNDEWIVTRTGIKERRILSTDKATSDMGVIAAQNALEMAGLKPEDVDLIIFGTSTPDMVFPATANIVQKKLGCRDDVPGFDIQVACSSYLYGMVIANQFIQSGTKKHVLVIAGDTMSRIVNYEDRSTCILFGDGASAVLLGASEENHFLGYDFGSNGFIDDEILSVPAGGSRKPLTPENIHLKEHFIQMKGSEVYRLALKYMSETVIRSLKNANIDVADVDFVIPHQANIRIMEKVAKKLGVSMDRVINTIQMHANTSGSTVGMALDIAIRDNRIKRGDILALTAFGAGLSWGSGIIRF